MALVVGGFIGRRAWVLSPRLRHEMRGNLALALPAWSLAERDCVARHCLLHLGLVGGEMIFFVGRSNAIERYVEVPPDALAVIRRGACAAGASSWFSGTSGTGS